MEVLPTEAHVGAQMGDVAEISRRPKRKQNFEDAVHQNYAYRKRQSIAESDAVYPHGTDYNEQIELSVPGPVHFSHASDPLAQRDETRDEFADFQDVDQQLSADPAKLEMQDLARDEQRKDNRRIMKSAVISGIITFTFTTLGTWWWARGQEDMKDLGKLARNETVNSQ